MLSNFGSLLNQCQPNRTVKFRTKKPRSPQLPQLVTLGKLRRTCFFLTFFFFSIRTMALNKMRKFQISLRRCSPSRKMSQSFAFLKIAIQTSSRNRSRVWGAEIILVQRKERGTEFKEGGGGGETGGQEGWRSSLDQSEKWRICRQGKLR